MTGRFKIAIQGEGSPAELILAVGGELARLLSRMRVNRHPPGALADIVAAGLRLAALSRRFQETVPGNRRSGHSRARLVKPDGR